MPAWVADMVAAELGPKLRFWLLVALAGYLLIVLLAWCFQRHLIYFPTRTDVPLPEAAKATGLRAVTIETADGETLQAWHRPGRKAGTVLFFHGNAGHRGHRLGYIEGWSRLGYGILLPDYRGYGGSSGEPSEAGFAEDAKACRRWLDQMAPGPIVYHGSSIGAGVACELARTHPPSALILQSAFSSLADVGRHAYPILPIGWILKDRFENEAKVDACGCPLLMIHGDADRIVPMALGRRVYERAQAPKMWWPVEGAGHNDLVPIAGAAYWQGIEAFLDEYLAR